MIYKFLRRFRNGSYYLYERDAQTRTYDGNLSPKRKYCSEWYFVVDKLQRATFAFRHHRAEYYEVSTHGDIRVRPNFPTLLAANQAGRVDPLLLLVPVPLSPGWILEISTPLTLMTASASTRIRARPTDRSSPSVDSSPPLLMVSTVRSASPLAALYSPRRQIRGFQAVKSRRIM